MNCENCGSSHDGNYGSGRFCSSKCARGFSTKEKRSLINEKVKRKLKKKYFQKICENCGNDFKMDSAHKDQKTCSVSCASKLRWKNKEYRDKITQSTIDYVISGKRKGTPKARRFKYNFLNKEIRCDSKVEYSCLNYFEEKFRVKDIKRCNFHIDYKIKGKTKKYIPGFIIKTEDAEYIVECKCFFGITDEIKNSKSWNNYYSSIEPKKEALKKYCKDNNKIEFFYTRDLNRKFYDSV